MEGEHEGAVDTILIPPGAHYGATLCPAHPCNALCHFNACLGLSERRIVRGSFEAHADDVSLTPDPRLVLWAGRPIG